jgi:type IV pilus assembly protein PilN
VSVRDAILGFMRTCGWPFLAAAGTALVIQGAAALFLEPDLSKESEALAYMKGEVAKLDRGIDDIRSYRASIRTAYACHTVSAAFQADRNLPIELLDELARARPDGMRFTVLDQYGGSVELKGEARSYLMISELFDRIESSPVLERASLRSVTAPPPGSNAGAPLAFEVRMRIRNRPEGVRPAALTSDAQDPR